MIKTDLKNGQVVKMQRELFPSSYLSNVMVQESAAVATFFFCFCSKSLKLHQLTSYLDLYCEESMPVS